MELKNNPNVFFDELSHTYLCGDKELMGVTTLLKKHGLAPDYSAVPEKVLTKAAEKGTELHKRIEDYDNQLTPFADDFIDSYVKTCQQYSLKFLVNELLVSDEEMVASMIDGVYAGSKPDSVRLVDYKSTLKIHWASLKWQLSIYKYLFEKAFPDIKVESLHVLWIDKKAELVNGFYPVDEIPREKVEALLDAERKGLIYIDTDEGEAQITDALEPSEVEVIVSNAAKIVELENTIKMLKAADEQIREKLVAYMTENNLTELPCPGGTFKLKAAYTSKRIDTKKVKELYPAIYERVATDSVTKASITFKPDKQ